MTDRTEAWLRGCADQHQRWRQQAAAVLYHRLPVAIRQKSEVPDLDETAGQNMHQETADELHRVE